MRRPEHLNNIGADSPLQAEADSRRYHHRPGVSSNNVDDGYRILMRGF